MSWTTYWGGGGDGGGAVGEGKQVNGGCKERPLISEQHEWERLGWFLGEAGGRGCEFSREGV